MITGSIELDGSIGQVGGITAKAIVSKQRGATLFLVPPGQTYEQIEELVCEWIGWVEYCDITYRTVNVAEEAKISIVEVKNINEALNYLLV